MTTIATNRYVGVSNRNEFFNLGGGEPIFVDGGAGDDYISSLNQNDLLIGGAGNDVIDAIGGSDVIFGDTSDPTSLDGGSDFIVAGWGSDIVFGGGGNDFIFGGRLNINQEDVGDLLFGDAGNDEIWGGLGNNVLDGGAGNDILYGYMPLAGTVNLSSYSRTINYTHNGENDAAVSGSVTLALTGSLPSSPWGSNSVLRGGDGDDMLYGSGGADILEGGRDNDTLDGGPGADWLDGGHGIDTATYASSSVAVVVRLDIGVGAGGDAAQDMLVSIERLIGSGFADYLIGGAVSETLLGMAGDDWLYGQGGADVLVGGAGNDQLLGGAGADDLYGQQGNDQFWFLAADLQSGVFDRIFDFGENLGGGNFDYLRFEGVPAATLTFTDFAGYCLVSTTALGGSGGVIVFGMTAAQLADQIIIA